MTLNFDNKGTAFIENRNYFPFLHPAFWWAVIRDFIVREIAFVAAPTGIVFFVKWQTGAITTLAAFLSSSDFCFAVVALLLAGLISFVTQKTELQADLSENLTNGVKFLVVLITLACFVLATTLYRESGLLLLRLADELLACVTGLLVLIGLTVIMRRSFLEQRILFERKHSITRSRIRALDEAVYELEQFYSNVQDVLLLTQRLQCDTDSSGHSDKQCRITAVDIRRREVNDLATGIQNSLKELVNITDQWGNPSKSGAARIGKVRRARQTR